MQFTLTTFLFILITCLTQAQSLTGTVCDSRHEPLPGAAVRLLRAADSTLVKGDITGASGKFTFTGLSVGRYCIHITSVGNQDFRSGEVVFDGAQSGQILPVFIMTASQKILHEVTVKAKKPLLEQELDRTIVNVEAMIGAAAGNSLDVLQKTPGVSVDVNGEISLNGKTGVLVLIDGRPTYMSGQDLAIYLKSLPGGAIDKLELMTNPPSRYDAAGTAIINIRLKRSKLAGLTGNVTLSVNQGITSRSYNVLSLNYNRKKVNLFGSLGYNKDGNQSTDTYDRTFLDARGGVTSAVQLSNRYRTSGQGLTGRFGADVLLTPKTTVGFVWNRQQNPRTEQLTYTSRSLDRSGSLDSVGTGTTDGRYAWNHTSINVNAQHTIGKSGREISADLNHIQYDTDGEQLLTNQVAGAAGNMLSRQQFLYKLPTHIRISSAKVDYTHPLPNKGRLEAGAKSSWVANDNDAQYQALKGLDYRPDYGRSNHFLYDEAIHAGYVSLRKGWQRLAIQGGLRLENTQISGRLSENAGTTASSFTRRYTNLFPSVFASYKLDSTGKNTVTGSFTRRINRPGYQSLNPFLAYRDQYTYTSGNPLLKPVFHNQYELKWQHKHLIGVALQYNDFNDVIFQLTRVVDGIFVTRPENVAKGRILSLSTNLSLAPAPWWTLNLNVMTARLALRGDAYSEKLRTTVYHARLNVMQQFQLGHGWSGEWTSYYSSNDVSGQTITRARFRMAAGVQKKLWKDKGSLRLTLEDMFRSWKTVDRTVSLFQSEAIHTNVSDTRWIGLALTWRFGQEKFARKRSHSDNAADAEKGRVN
ncbi:outer membrane beta-barrel protein [Arsenicibacter rosenii]|uniref:Uncharacterized protein n=1 Tax=Arsenicibacter rosenii TaxID=1750698 RepID=A0A1S2VB13_9BACT|nr:outer membrane beta-barrel protein [Arsenicibacter rosenii]OIN55911.1 hypothetical protein BLX24_27560 [Arsenicibacter rosenii]